MYSFAFVDCVGEVSRPQRLGLGFKKEKALAGAFSVVVTTDGSFAALDCILDVHCSSSPSCSGGDVSMSVP